MCISTRKEIKGEELSDSMWHLSLYNLEMKKNQRFDKERYPQLQWSDFKQNIKKLHE